MSELNNTPEKYTTLDLVVEKLHLTNLIPEIDLSKIKVDRASINRPALQLIGYYEFLDTKRIEVIGRAEYEYLKTLEQDVVRERLDKLFSFKFPGLIVTRGMQPMPVMIELGKKYGVPVLTTDQKTAIVIVGIIRYLSELLGPTDSMHGVLVDVYGEGILITGESGVGKSEAAIELIKRGHRLVSDDLVEIRKVSEDILMGSAPKITKHLIELRGIGVVDAKSLFGIESVKERTQIDMIINMEEWKEGVYYDRLGLENEYQVILGVPIVKHNLPVSPGRNLAIIIETAAVNNRQKKMGYNTAEALCEEMKKEISEKSKTQ